MKITAHCLVKNEENFVWFAINSALNQVDEILVWDTGSQDKTVKIIQSIKSPKISFEQKGEVDTKGLSGLRQEMLDKTQADWIMILDGDEIWYNDAISNIKFQISTNDQYDVVVSKTLMAVGDIFHYQDESAGRYKIVDKIGHYNIRFIRNMPDLHIVGEYPHEAYADTLGTKVQNYPKDSMLFVEKPYLHLSHIKRSSVDRKKFKHEIGHEVSRDFFYPEVAFRPRPDFVKSPWQTLSTEEKISSLAVTPLRKLKRKFI